jgi:chromosome segregation ATPase
MPPDNLLQWLPIGIQLVGFGVAYGAMRQQQATFKRDLDDVHKRMGLFDAAKADSERERADLLARMKAAEADIVKADTQRERLIDVVDKTARELIAFRAAAEEQHKTIKSDVDGLCRNVKSLERQLANAALRKAPFYDAQSEEFG